MNFWFWSRSKSPFFPKMAKFKPSTLLKDMSKANLNHWFMCLISQGTRIVKKVELGLRINLLVVRYVDISPYFENRQIQIIGTRRYWIWVLNIFFGFRLKYFSFWLARMVWVLEKVWIGIEGYPIIIGFHQRMWWVTNYKTVGFGFWRDAM